MPDDLRTPPRTSSLRGWLFARRAAVTGPPPASGPDRSAPAQKPSGLQRVWSFLLVIVLVIAGGFLLRRYLVETFYIPSGSMEPTLHGCFNCPHDDRVLVEKLSYDFHDPRRGDVVVFNHPTTWRDVHEPVLIKRVVGVPGDTLVVRRGHVVRDGVRLQESYVKRCGGLTTPGQGPTSLRRRYTVPPGELFVMGDNRCDSEDSRFEGPVPISNVIGKAFLIVWPLGRVGTL